MLAVVDTTRTQTVSSETVRHNHGAEYGGRAPLNVTFFKGGGWIDFAQI
jgi:hypothetical protein